MDKQKFLDQQTELNSNINQLLKESNLTKININTLNSLLNTLNSYTFDNRFQSKGLLSRVVIDTIIPKYYSIGESLIQFDENIN